MKIKTNKKGQAGGGVIIGLVFAIVLVMIGVQVSNTLGTTATTVTNVNQTIGTVINDTAYNVTLTAVDQGVVVTTMNVTNGTFSLNSGNFSVSATGSLDVLFDGVVSITGMRANYDYQQFGYVTGVTSTMILLIPLFMGLAALGIAAAFFAKKS